MSTETVVLDLLGSGFAIETDGTEWSDFLRQIWAPFLSDRDDGLPLRLRRAPDTWVLETAEGETARDSNPWFIADQLRHVMVDEALSNPGSFLDLHSAVLARDEGCVLVVGGSRSGKTTLSLALVESGWRLMSDDVALIHMNTGRVHPFPKPLAIRDEVLWARYSDRWSPPQWPRVPRGGLLLPAAAVGAVATAPEVPVSMVFASFDDQGEPKQRSVSAAEAVALCGQYVRNVTGDRLNVLTRTCAAVGRREVTYRSSAEGVAAIEDAFHAHHEKMGSSEALGG
ncbi:MAG: hypothetical protein QOG04_87 [Actinomycetota bacterium]|nr:hypothetical protein [Actinomycetota bacterium]